MKPELLKLGKYPYTYARVSVMKSNLLSREDYHKLLKMSLSEVISFLQASQYKKAIDELAVKYSDVELMEMALNKNLVETWQKLRRISPEEVTALIDAYLMRSDLWNVKTIIRGIHTNSKQEAISAMLLLAGKFGWQKLAELAKSDSVEEVLKKLGAAKKRMTEAIEAYKSKNTLVEIENELDREYYSSLLAFAKRIPTEGRHFHEFLATEIEATNIINILRLRRAGMPKQEIAKYITGKPSNVVNSLLATEGKEETAKILAGRISEKALHSFATTGKLSEVELEIGRSLLRKTTTLIHKHPLTVDVILGYMFAKEIEVKNLKLILKARQLELGNEFAEQQIIA